jgi:hypothetical protein
MNPKTEPEKSTMKSTLFAIGFTSVVCIVLIRLNNSATPTSTLGKVFGKA